MWLSIAESNKKKETFESPFFYCKLRVIYFTTNFMVLLKPLAFTVTK